MRAIGLAGLLAIGLTLAATSARAEVVRHRVSLPLEGAPVDLAPLAGPGSSPVRVRLTGTLSSTLDGSEIDAIGRQAGGQRFEAEGPFVRLPSGARLVEADEGAHSYLFELPRGASIPVALNLAPLAMRNLVTWSEMVQSCTGAVEVEILGAPATSAEIVGEAALVEAPWISTLPVAGAGLVGLVFTLLGGGLLMRRHRRKPEVALTRRIGVAARAVRSEAASLGPAFDHVAVAAGELLDTAGHRLSHLAETRSALRRLGRLRAAGAELRRETLLGNERALIDGLGAVAERLEETAAGLVACRVDQHRPVEPEALLLALSEELEAALSATEEAGLTQPLSL